MYYNYHKHDHEGNMLLNDSIAKIEDYCCRASELGHNAVFTTNHGMQGNIFDLLPLAKKYGLKAILGTEAYYVSDHTLPERGQHIIIIAKNNNGAKQINRMLSNANEPDYIYYKPRIDKALLFSLNPHDVIVTTACVAGVWQDTELVVQMKNYFKNNFFLEVQNHNEPSQIDMNKRILQLSASLNVPMIHANDSHYIYPEDAKYRDIFLKGKGLFYSDDAAVEKGFILDYPDEKTILNRYARQGVLTQTQAQEALENTLVFDECEELTYINYDIKLPPISDNPMRDLREIVFAGLEEMKRNGENAEPYEDAVKGELKTIEDTGMGNYFLIDYKIAKRAQEVYGGKLTNTGRGSAPSFIVNSFLGLTDIDRLKSPITLYPSRFMSTERILNARSLPDIDLNTADREPFIKATEDILGEENCAWMLTRKPLQASSAFRTYCKGIGLDIADYNDVAMNLESFENDPKWHDIIAESKRFVGVIESMSESSCSMLLYDKPVKDEIGLIKTKTKMCCLLDGYNCDRYKYLKNDYLTVTVWAIIRDTCNLAGIDIPTIEELENLLDSKTFDIYKKGLTCTINQADSEYATPLAKTYCPKTVAEMSAFVAVLRPGCASLLDGFIHRRNYTTGVEELDKLLAEADGRMIYQELIMRYLIWLGIPEAGSYDIIKKIAKKKFTDDELDALSKKLKDGWVKLVGSEDKFAETWQIVQDAARYSFNACVSGNTRIRREDNANHFQPSVEEMYRIKNDTEYAKSTRYKGLRKKYLLHGYGNALSIGADGKVYKNKIVDIYDSGMADIYRVTTENGAYIDCTMNHKFPTSHGKKRLDELGVGDELYVMDKRGSCSRAATIKSRIESITYLREDKVYDIEMAAPLHNFISESGLVTSNSHSLCYAYDSLYGAYLKSHYPLEYYTVALRYYEGDLTHTSRLTSEMKHFGISMQAISFEHPCEEYSCDKSTNTIFKGIGSVKDLNKDTAKELKRLHDKREYDCFSDLLFDIKRETGISKRKLEPLILLDFFHTFGTPKKLMRVYAFFRELYSEKDNGNMKKSKIPEILTHDEIASVCERETAAMYMGVDRRALMRMIEHRIPDDRTSVQEIISAQDKYLGGIEFCDARLANYVYVIKVNEKFSPTITAYALKTGVYMEFKVNKKLYKFSPIPEGRIMYISAFHPRPKYKKTEDGFKPISGERVYQIDRYKIIHDGIYLE